MSNVAWWKLDETSGQVASDSIGDNDGLYRGNPTRTTGVVNNGLNFDGSGDYIVVSDSNTLDFGTGDFSISTSIKTTDKSGIDVILDKRIEQSGADQGYVLFNYNGKLAFQLADGSGFTNYISNTSIADGKWHDIAVTIDRNNSSGGKFYVDGKEAYQFNPTGRQGSLSNSANLTIGRRSDSSSAGYFNGSLDEIRLFDTALSATEVGKINQPDTLAVAWWKLDETFGTVASDSIGDNDGLYRGNPTRTTGVVNNGLNFDGSGDYIVVSDSNTLDFGTGDFSISTSIKTTDKSGIDVILDKRIEQSGADQGYVLFNYNGKLAFQLADGSGFTNYISNTSIADGKWHDIAVTIDRNNSSGGKFYVDGKEAYQFNPTGRQGSLSNSANLTIGRRSDSSSAGYFNGSLDEIRLFDTALTKSQVVDTLLGDAGNDLLDEVGQIDYLQGNSEADLFALGTDTTALYDDGDDVSNDINDYALIPDFEQSGDLI